MSVTTMVSPNVRRAKRSPNAMRADRVAWALAFYQAEALQERGPLGETVMTDLLADLRHLCDFAIVFDTTSRRSIGWRI